MIKKNKQNQQNLMRSTFIGMLWSFIGTLIQGIAQFIVLIVLTRLISPYDFGIVSAGLVIISFSVIFATLGVGPAIVQRDKIAQRHINVGFTLSIVLGTSIMIILWSSSAIISNFFNIPELINVVKALSIVFFIKGFAIVPLSLMQRDLNFKVIAKIQVLSYTLGYGLISILLAVFGFGYWSLILGHICQSLLDSFLTIKAKPHSKKIELNKNTAKELFFFGGGHTLGRILNYFAIHGDNLMVGRFLGASVLGIYSRAYQLMVMPTTLFGQVIDKVLFSSMSRIQNERDKLVKGYELGLKLTSVIVMPISVLMFFLSEEIVHVLFGNGWSAVIIPFKILSVGVFFRTSYKISDSIAQSTGYIYQRAWRQGVYALSVIIGSYIGHFWGLNGVVISILLALIINFLLMAQLTLSILKIKWLEFLRIHLSTITFSVFLYIEMLVFLDYLFISKEGIVRLFIAFFIYILTTIIFFRFLVGKEIYYYVKNLLRVSRKRIINEKLEK